MRLLLLCGPVLSMVSQCFTQTTTTGIVGDTTSIFRPAVAGVSSDTVRSDTGGYRPTKNPWLAVGLSGALPGLGQIYNRNYWKVPVVWGLGGYWIYEWVKLNKDYKDYGDQYSRSITPIVKSGDGNLLRLRDFYRDERDKFAWYLGALYFLNLVDAYVSAQLYDFDVSPDLGLDGRMIPRVTATIKWRF